MRKDWLVEIRKDPRDIRRSHHLSWPVIAHKRCWTRTGAHVWAGRNFGTTFGTHIRITHLGRIS